MTKLPLVGVFMLCLLALNQAAEEYTSKFDTIDIDGILKSDRLLTNYYNCLMDKGNCTPEGKELKDILPDAIETGCTKCSQKQKEAAKKIVKFLKENKKEQFEDLLNKYDPEMKFRKKYEELLKSEGLS